jgi:hypothetical protein
VRTLYTPPLAGQPPPASPPPPQEPANRGQESGKRFRAGHVVTTTAAHEKVQGQARPAQPARKENRTTAHPSKRRAHQPGHLNPPPTQLHRPPRRQVLPRPASEGPDPGQCPHVKAKTPSDEGECCARGGTRTAFPPPQTLGSPGNVGSPAPSGTSTTGPEAPSVYFVHTPNWPVPRITTKPHPSSLDRRKSPLRVDLM